MTEKINQRADIRKRIDLFTKKTQASEEIYKKAIVLYEYKKAKNVFIYLSTDKEVNTAKIIEHAFSKGKRVFVPVTKDTMFFSEIFADTIYVKGKYNINQPKEEKKTDIEPDIIFIPLVGFDEEKNRLGQGKGYYDRYLRNCKAKKVALAFSIQQANRIFIEKCDIKMDMIITEEKIF